MRSVRFKILYQLCAEAPLCMHVLQEYVVLGDLRQEQNGQAIWLASLVSFLMSLNEHHFLQNTCQKHVQNTTNTHETSSWALKFLLEWTLSGGRGQTHIPAFQFPPAWTCPAGEDIHVSWWEISQAARWQIIMEQNIVCLVIQLMSRSIFLLRPCTVCCSNVLCFRSAEYIFWIHKDAKEGDASVYRQKDTCQKRHPREAKGDRNRGSRQRTWDKDT